MNNPYGQYGQLVILSGPSGVGKSTVIAELLGQCEDLYFSISYTTRSPRMGEQDGVHYHFVDRSEFERMIAQRELLEYAEYVGHYYGTSLKETQEKLATGMDVLLDIEVQGAAKVRKCVPNAVFIFIIPPSFEELSRRLRGRNTDSGVAIGYRLEKARREFRDIPNYDYLVINDKVSNAVDEIQAILVATKCRVENRKSLLKGEFAL